MQGAGVACSGCKAQDSSMPPCTTHGRLRHVVTFALIQMLEIVGIRIQEEYTYVNVSIPIPRMHICMHLCVSMYACIYAEWAHQGTCGPLWDKLHGLGELESEDVSRHLKTSQDIS